MNKTSTHSEFQNIKINRLLQRTGYNIVQLKMQRIYSLSNLVRPPLEGCDVYFGNIPRDLFEDELVPIFEKLGDIYQMRLVIDFNGFNRGFGFVSYFKPDIANAAISLLNGYNVKPGYKMSVIKNINNTLYVGGLPLEKTKEEVYQALSLYMEGIKNVVMYYTYGNKNLNRGFVFVEFYDHRLAALARTKLCPGSLVLWGVLIFIEWSNPIPEVPADILSKVKNLYISNLNINLNHADLWKEISKMVPIFPIIKVHKKLDYAFVNFTTRNAAEDAMNAMQGMLINGEPIKITWARPKCYSNTHVYPSLLPRLKKHMQVRQTNKTESKYVNSKSVPINLPMSYENSKK